jgi:hypothetical protein
MINYFCLTLVYGYRNWFVIVKRKHEGNVFKKRILGIKREEIITT